MAGGKDLTEAVLAIVRRRFRHLDPDGLFSGDDFLHAGGRATEALLLAALFCPPLVEVEGSVLLRQLLETESEKRRFLEYRETKGRVVAESSFNCVEVPYLFGPGGSDLSDEEDRVLAEVIAASWRGWLCSQYPGRKFLVEVLEPQQTGSVVGVHFYEEVRV